MKLAKACGVLLLWLALLPTLFGCAQRAAVAGNADETLRVSLREFQGTFVWREDMQDYEFRDLSQLDELLTGRDPDALVGTLIEWLDDATPSQTTFEGRAVPLGLVCYRALTLLVYYEPADAAGDIRESWEGFLTPASGLDEQRAAKAAWRQAAAARQLIAL